MVDDALAKLFSPIFLGVWVEGWVLGDVDEWIGTSASDFSIFIKAWYFFICKR
ncbi:MAG TPA: hypothetical protein VMT57_07785 [Candidatus Thermoplasmatota archaeon]|nr:hypothetical protein [Candidatus Thermoplasmatota archaeon]